MRVMAVEKGNRRQVRSARDSQELREVERGRAVDEGDGGRMRVIRVCGNMVGGSGGGGRGAVERSD